MANGTELLPQSALPIGQTPLATIQRPTVPVTVPNPIDVSNFFRMQQGMQGNLGILRNAEEFKLRKQQVDLQNYKDRIGQMDQLLGMTNGAFSDFYDEKVSRRSQASSPLFEGLDPTRGRHQEAMRRNNAKIDGAQAQIDQLGKTLFASGSSDDASTFETVRNIKNVVSKTRREMEQDKEFFELSRTHRAYNQWLDQLKAAEARGANINVAAVDQLEEEYNRWTEDGTGNININRFRIQDYIYDAPSVLKSMAKDAELLGKGASEFEEVNTQGGGVLEGKRVTRRSLGEISEAMANKYMGNKDAVALYNNTIKGRTNPDGSPYTFKNWMTDMSAPFAPIEGKESVIANTESTIIKPGTSPATSTASKRGTINVLGRDAKDGAERRVVSLGDNVQQKGFDIGKSDLTPYDWGKMGELDKEGRLLLVEVDENGRRVGNGKGVAMQAWDLGQKDRKGVVVSPQKLLTTFPKGAKTQEGEGASAPPTRSIYKHSPKQLPVTSAAIRTKTSSNNPLAVKATPEQEQAGVNVDGEGNVVYDTLKEGVEAGFKQINEVDLAGKSDQFAQNARLVKKYGIENLGQDKYLDVVTVEDMMHVRNPLEEDGGVTTQEDFEKKLKHLEERGYPRDLKIGELKDKYNFNASLLEFENPDAYTKSFGKGGAMPSAHSENITVVEDADSPENIKAKSQGFEVAKTATFSDEGLARNSLDRVMMGDETVTPDELRHLFNNPPEELKGVVEEAQAVWEKQQGLLDEVISSDEEIQIMRDMGEAIPEGLLEENSRLHQALDDTGFDGAGNQITKIIRSAVAKEIEPDLINESIDDLVSEDGIAQGDFRAFQFQRGDNVWVGFRRSAEDPDVYGIIPFRVQNVDGEEIRTFGKYQKMTRSELGDYMKNHFGEFTEESASQLMNPDEINKKISKRAEASLTARKEELAKQQFQLDEMTKAANDQILESRTAKDAKKASTPPASGTTQTTVATEEDEGEGFFSRTGKAMARGLGNRANNETPKKENPFLKKK